MSDAQISQLITALLDSYKTENAQCTDDEIEYIVISGRKEFNHAYKIKTKSGKLFAQKIYFVTTELEHHIKDAIKYEKEYLRSLFSEYVNPQIVPPHLIKCSIDYIETFDNNNEKDRKTLYDELFLHVLENPLESFSYSWWNFYITYIVRDMHDVYFISNFTEL